LNAGWRHERRQSGAEGEQYCRHVHESLPVEPPAAAALSTLCVVCHLGKGSRPAHGAQGRSSTNFLTPLWSKAFGLSSRCLKLEESLSAFAGELSRIGGAKGRKA
jgi:hypothetical protein